MNRIDEIEERLSKVTKGNWRKVDAGKSYKQLNYSSKTHYDSKVEDDSIVSEYGEEVLGCSEWLRCEDADFDFLVNSKSDIEFLLDKVEFLERIISHYESDD